MNEAHDAPVLFDDLSELFSPHSIALVGASDRADSMGRRTLENLTIHGDFRGELHLVNPMRAEIGGRRCWPSIEALPAGVRPTVAIIVIPGAGVLEAIRQCAQRGVRFAIVLSSGFGEESAAGKALETEMRRTAHAGGMRVYGPNCPGIVNIRERLGLTFSPAFRDDLRPGSIAIATQGGALGRNLLQGGDRGCGYAAWASSGNEADLQLADFIHHFSRQPDVRGVLALLEGVRDGRRFAAAALAATRGGRGIGLLKIGRSEYGMKAAASHTASITGVAEVNSAVFAQLGITEVDDVDELVDFGALLARAQPCGRDGIAVYGSSGGACALVADILGAAGVELAEFAPATLERLRSRLPSYAAIDNPVDTTAITLSDPSVIDHTLLAVAEDPTVGLVVLPYAIDYAEVTGATARRFVELQSRTGTPIVPIWMSERLGEGYRVFAEAGMTPMRSARNAGKAIRRWLAFGRWLAERADRPDPLLLAQGIGPEARSIRLLTEPEGKVLLGEAGLPVPPARIAASAAQAGLAAEAFGAPVAMKIIGRDIVHKTDVGGVALGIADSAAARAAWERIIAAVRTARPDVAIEGVLLEPMAPAGGLEVLVGISRDAVFGYMLTLGLGGVHLELSRDVARAMLPVDARMCAELLAGLRSAPLFDGMRGHGGYDVDALGSLVEALSTLVVSRGHGIEEIELNPVWVGPKGAGVQVLDALVRLREY
ncbi:MAG: acetate--CoA ligase family protein [Burkholderiaceae bacterium]